MMYSKYVETVVMSTIQSISPISSSGHKIPYFDTYSIDWGKKTLA